MGVGRPGLGAPVDIAGTDWGFVRSVVGLSFARGGRVPGRSALAVGEAVASDGLDGWDCPAAEAV